MGEDGEVKVYANITIQKNSPINKDLLLDHNATHIYIMTKNTVSIQEYYILNVFISVFLLYINTYTYNKLVM